MGYRWYDARKMPVRWPFGHGLSYTGWLSTAARRWTPTHADAGRHRDRAGDGEKTARGCAEPRSCSSMWPTPRAHWCRAGGCPVRCAGLRRSTCSPARSGEVVPYADAAGYRLRVTAPELHFGARAGPVREIRIRALSRGHPRGAGRRLRTQKVRIYYKEGDKSIVSKI